MDELVQRVREALSAEYPGAPNGRVRDVPDRRAIRWYTTIGLVDKPLGMRGRTALYGPRHLQQLVAIKRLQAAGRSLAQIQIEFTWLAPEQLGEVARVPDRLLVEQDGGLTPDHSAAVTRHRFWAAGPAAGEAAPVADLEQVAAIPVAAEAAAAHPAPAAPPPAAPPPAAPPPAAPPAAAPPASRSA
ncbi:MAG: MerR family transcriptional regulator, partial [Actinoplanes sp.]